MPFGDGMRGEVSATLLPLTRATEWSRPALWPGELGWAPDLLVQ